MDLPGNYWKPYARPVLFIQVWPFFVHYVTTCFPKLAKSGCSVTTSSTFPLGPINSMYVIICHLILFESLVYIRVRWHRNKWWFFTPYVEQMTNMFSPETCAGRWLESCRPSDYFLCAAILFFFFLSANDMRHVWSLMTKSCVHAPLLHKGETKKS